MTLGRDGLAAFGESAELEEDLCVWGVEAVDDAREVDRYRELDGQPLRDTPVTRRRAATPRRALDIVANQKDGLVENVESVDRDGMHSVLQQLLSKARGFRDLGRSVKSCIRDPRWRQLFSTFSHVMLTLVTMLANFIIFV